MQAVGRQQHILSKLQNKYWFVRANLTARKVLANRTHCRKRFSRPLVQKMANLHEQGLNFTKQLFSYLDLYYFSPFCKWKGRAKVLKYGSIFTCSTIRADHIKIAFNLDTLPIIQAFKPCLAHRGSVI